MKKLLLLIIGFFSCIASQAANPYSLQGLTGLTNMQLLVRGGLIILIGFLGLLFAAAAGLALLHYAGNKIRNFMAGGGGDAIKHAIGWGHGSGFWGMGSASGSVKQGKLISGVQSRYDAYKRNYLRITPRQAYRRAYSDYRFDSWSRRNRYHRYNYRYSQDY